MRPVLHYRGHRHHPECRFFHRLIRSVNSASQDPVLDTLLLPFDTGALALPGAGRALFLRARTGAGLRRFAPAALVCEQSFKPDADRLRDAGFAAVAAPDERFGLVLILPPRSRDEARILFAQALQRVTVEGVVIACVANTQGARSLEADLQRVAGSVTSLSKHKCRVFWTHGTAVTRDEAVLAEWLQLDQPHLLPGSDLHSRAGVFSADAIDAASQLLAAHLPTDLIGCAADLGAGNGYLSVALLARNPGISAIELYEAEARALDVARLNLAQQAQACAVSYHWHDVSTGLPTRHDVIVMNPPFHQGRADAPDLGRTFIIAAARALHPGGQLWLVANRHLPYEAVLAEQFAHVDLVCDRDGFKVIAARKAA